MIEFVLATQNEKKRQELSKISKDFGAFENAKVSTLTDVGIYDLDVVEDAPTFLGNAHKKVDALLRALAPSLSSQTHRLVIIADDSGLCVDALDGRPGVRSARYAQDAGREKSDANNNALLIEELKNKNSRRAHFACGLVACVLEKENEVLRLESLGKVYGNIGDEARGTNGFGYDPYFYSDEHSTRSMAELEPHEKHAISHRGKAVRELLESLSRSLSSERS